MNADNKKDVIVHLWTAGPFMEESTYQETMLANANKKDHDRVYIVTTNMRYGLDGSVTICETGHYKNSHGVDIVRLNTHRSDLKSRRDIRMVYNELLRIQPDFIMNHVFNPTSCMAVHLYKKKNPQCKVVADSHMTRCNSYGEKLSFREKIICLLMRLTGILCYADVDKFYGITEETVEMMIDLYGVPQNKAELLYLGYDSDKVHFDDSEALREKLRRETGITDDKLIFVSGGKLSPIKNVIELVRVFKQTDNCALIIFGDFSDDEYESKVKKEAGDGVIFTGSLKSDEIYDLYMACDVAIFPGNPSCLRQEAVACGLPIIMACNDKGDETINIIMNSNGISLKRNWTDEELSDAINELVNNFAKYKKRALELAEGEYRKYSYTNQAQYILIN